MADWREELGVSNLSLGDCDFLFVFCDNIGNYSGDSLRAPLLSHLPHALEPHFHNVLNGLVSFLGHATPHRPNESRRKDDIKYQAQLVSINIQQHVRVSRVANLLDCAVQD